MIDSDKTEDVPALNNQTPGEVGDPEDAGETTAADTITGPVDTRPVGADTMLKVSDAANQEKNPHD